MKTRLDKKGWQADADRDELLNYFLACFLPEFRTGHKNELTPSIILRALHERTHLGREPD
jgi:hypothetical protein